MNVDLSQPKYSKLTLSRCVCVYLPALLGIYIRPTKQPTYRPSNQPTNQHLDMRVQRELSIFQCQ